MYSSAIHAQGGAEIDGHFDRLSDRHCSLFIIVRIVIKNRLTVKNMQSSDVHPVHTMDKGFPPYLCTINKN